MPNDLDARVGDDRDRPSSEGLVDPADEESIPGDPRGRETFQHRRGARLHILSVHDTQAMRQLVGRLLRQFDGVDEVVPAGSVEEAIDALQELPFDFVVCDWDFAGSAMSGLELLQALRAAGWTTPFGLLVAEPDDALVREGLGWGADFVLVKPFVADELAKAIGVAEHDEGGRRREAYAAVDDDASRPEALSQVLSRLCQAKIVASDSKAGVDLHRARYVASYVVDTIEEPPPAYVVFETRLAASLASALIRQPMRGRQEWRATGVLSSLLVDGFTEVAHTLGRFVRPASGRVRLARVAPYPPGERLELGEAPLSRIERITIEVEGYEGGVCSLLVL